MAKLNLDTFNNLLFQVLKEQTPEMKKKLLEAELEAANNIMFGKMCCLCDELTEIGYKSALLTEIGNIKDNAEHLLEQLKDIDEQIAAGEDSEAAE